VSCRGDPAAGTAGSSADQSPTLNPTPRNLSQRACGGHCWMRSWPLLLRVSPWFPRVSELIHSHVLSYPAGIAGCAPDHGQRNLSVRAPMCFWFRVKDSGFRVYPRRRERRAYFDSCSVFFWPRLHQFILPPIYFAPSPSESGCLLRDGRTRDTIENTRFQFLAHSY
jgi:hypothetical protein